MGKVTWNEQDIQKLKELYNKLMPMASIAKQLNRSIGAVSSKADKLGLSKQFIKSNNPNFKAVYQDYDWCYERYINRGMTMKEMAKEANASLRVIQKWCSEIHRLNEDTFKKEKHLSELQRQVIMFGKIGDGHIDRRVEQPMYIESHAENQKDYLYWKYNILKDLCNKEPKYYPAKLSYFTTTKKEYMCQPTYRINTRIIDELKEIRSMNISDILNQINEFGLCLHMLDDGYRSRSNWGLCVAEWSNEEVQLYINICFTRFGLVAYRKKDKRYLNFDAESSRKIDSLILAHIPNDLDIVKYKILDNYICKAQNNLYVVVNNEQIGLTRYCHNQHNLDYYEKVKKYMKEHMLKVITLEQLKEIEGSVS